MQIVDLFEMINVAKKQRHKGAFSAGTLKLLIEQLKDDSAVPQGGERVMTRFESHLLTRFDEFVFELQNALSRQQACLQFLGMARLDQIIVSAGFKTHNDIV